MFWPEYPSRETRVKLLHEQEFVIGGYTEPEGTRQFFGSLIVGFYRRNELVFVGRVGTGFSTALLGKLYSSLKQIEDRRERFGRNPHTGVVY